MNQETLRQLIANCRRPSGRSIGFPNEWTPHRVELPGAAGFVFSDPGAWDLIADRLDSGHAYEEMHLDVPPGALAVVMRIELDPAKRPLYVKVQLGYGNRAIGRSFHYTHF